MSGIGAAFSSSFSTSKLPPPPPHPLYTYPVRPLPIFQSLPGRIPMSKFVLAFTFFVAATLPFVGQTNTGSSPGGATSSQSTTNSNPDQNTTNTPATQNASPTTTQTPNNANSDQVERTDNPVVYRVSVTQRSTQAVDYRDRGGTTQVDFKGTALMPKADGRALVTGHTGRLAIDARFHHLRPARTLGPEYLTYV